MVMLVNGSRGMPCWERMLTIGKSQMPHHWHSQCYICDRMYTKNNSNVWNSEIVIDLIIQFTLKIYSIGNSDSFNVRCHLPLVSSMSMRNFCIHASSHSHS